MKHFDIFIYFILLILLSSSCSKLDDDSSSTKKNNINKEFIIQAEGSFSDSYILAEKYSNFYPSQMFLKKDLIEDGIFSETPAEVHPYSLIFDFYPIPYIEDILEPKGFLSFTKVLTNAMKSDEWKIYSESGITKSQLVSCAIYTSKDDAKAYLGEPSLYRLLSENESEYIFLAKIISSQFDILTNMNDNIVDKNNDDACYVSTVTIGRYAYLSISTNENPEKIMDLFMNGILKNDLTYTEEYLKIASSVNIIERGGSNNNGYWGEEGFCKLVEIFDTNHRYFGVPILFNLKDAITQEVITIKN